MRWITGAAVLIVALLAWQLSGAAPARTSRAERHGAAPDAVEPAPRDAAEENAEPVSTVLEGWVLDDATGDAVAGAHVGVHGVDDDTTETAPFATTRTDAAGGFRLPLEGAALLRVVAPGYLPEVRPVDPLGNALVRLTPAPACTFLVVDVANRPVAGASARLYERTDLRPLAVAHSDDDGTCTLPVAGGTKLFVSAQGYRVTEVRPPRRVLRQPVVLRPGAEIEGIVVDVHGTPVSGVRVVLDRSFQPVRDATTDAAGRFRIDGLDPSIDEQVSIEHPGCVPIHEPVVPGSVDLRFVLTPPASTRTWIPITGVAEGPDGAPVEGAHVSCTAGGAFTRTARDGSFTLSARPDATCRLSAYAGELPALPGERNPPSALRGSLTVALPAPPVRLRLERIPRSFAALRFLDGNGRPREVATVRPGVTVQPGDAEGRLVAAFESPAGSRLDLVAWNSMLETPFSAVTHARPDCEEQVVVLERHPRADLFVRLPDGSPLPASLRAEASVYGPQAAPIPGTERHDGFSFEFDPDAAPWCRGRLSLGVSAPGYLTSRPWPPLPEDGGTVEVRLEQGVRVTGVLVDSGGVPPRTGARIRAIAPDREGAVFDRTTEPGDGAFEFPALPPGPLRLLASQGPLWWRGSLEAQAGAHVDLGVIRLSPGEAMRGLVVDDGGRPLSGVRIETFGDIGTATATNARGEFTLPLPEWMEVDVQARKAGHGTVRVPLARAGGIVLPTPGSVLLRVVRDESRPRVTSAWSIHAGPPGAGWDWQPERGGEPTGDRMIRRYVDLPPGPLEFRLQTMDGVSRVTVDVIAGRTVEATLRFP